jgi:hypothetical protein
MKFPSTITFAFWTPLFLVLTNLKYLSSSSGSAQAFLLPGDNIPLNILPEYVELLGLCNAAGANAVS